jgi:ABC-2 type transport system ATP-binding protein
MDYSILLHEATKIFNANTVLDKVSVQFETGKIHGVIGRNGSGKTVMFKCICGFYQLNGGQITIGGVDRKKIKMQALNIGAIIEQPGFIPTLSGYQNLKYLAKIKGIISKAEIKKSINMVGLDPASKKHVCKYSTGMRQRLGIAQAIMENPDILVLDEPMNGLDDSGVDEFRKLFCTLRTQGRTILLASHNMDDIDSMCDTLSTMSAGRLVPIRGF